MSGQLASVIEFVGNRPPLEFPATPGARVVMVGSGKGGIGTSTVASLLALALSAAERKVLLVDAVDGQGVQHLLLEGGSLADSGKAGRGHRRSADGTIRVSENLSLVPGFDVEPTDIPAPAAMRRAQFRQLGRLFPAHDVVVVDGGSRLASVLTACAAGVDLLLVVTTADRICLAANYALVKAIGTRLGERPVVVLGNRIDEEQARDAAELIDSASRHFLERTTRFIGTLPDDACLAAGIAAGMPIQDAAGGSPAAAAMDRIAAVLLNEIASPPGLEGRHQHRRS